MTLMQDVWLSLRASQFWVYPTWFRFVLKYRRAALGPLWIIVGPAMFVGFLGYMYANVMSVPLSEFVPHLAVGFTVWTLFSGFVIQGTTVYVRHRSEILQGETRLTDVSFADIFSTFLIFLHQIVVVVVVFLYFKRGLPPGAVVAFAGLVIVCLNGVFLSVILGTLGARFRDLVEFVSSVMRLCFFITPVIWIPVNGTGGVLGKFLIFNPFYHFMEIIRAPLMGNPISSETWTVVLIITVIGFFAASFIYRNVSHRVALWV